MADSPLITKSKEFALQVIKVCNYVKLNKTEYMHTNQLVLSGTSMGATSARSFTDTALRILLKNCKYTHEAQFGLAASRGIAILFVGSRVENDEITIDNASFCFHNRRGGIVDVPITFAKCQLSDGQWAYYSSKREYIETLNKEWKKSYAPILLDPDEYDLD